MDRPPVQAPIAKYGARRGTGMESKGAKIGRPDLAPFRAVVAPAYAKAKEKYGADVDAVLADADAVRKALPAK